MIKATVTGKRQITIPKEICDLLNIEKGNQIIFKEEDGKIIFDIDKEHEKCFACNGTTKVDGKECFVCRGTGELETSIAHNIYQIIWLIGEQSRKYGVSFSFIQKEVDEENQIVYSNDFPTIELRSKEYSESELNGIQDEIQKIIIEQFTPRSSSDENLFDIPSDCVLNEILDTLVTEDAKKEVTNWFRYDRTTLNHREEIYYE